MRKKNTFSALLTLFLLVPASITWAQTISSQKGLTTAVFTTSAGIIKVYLPDDIRPGDLISGRVIAEPEGRNEKQLARSLAELTTYSIRLNGEKFTVDNVAKTFQFSLPSGQPMQGSMDLMKAAGTNTVQQLVIPVKPPGEQKSAPAQCMIPGHVLSGSPMTISGPFDGNAANTQCTIGKQPANILAESPRSCIVAFPSDANGMQETKIIEFGNEPCSKIVSGVQMNVTAGKLNLLKGEKTYIDVSITGLQHLPDTALLSLTNSTTGIVVMQPSNMIAFPLSPDSVGSGTFNRRFDIQSIRTGSFSVNVNLDLPEKQADHPPTQPQPVDSSTTVAQCPKCNCSCSATIIHVEEKDGVSFYRVSVTASCTGKFGPAPCKDCGIIDAYEYEWQVSFSAGDGIEHVGSNKGSRFGFKNPQNAPFSLYINVRVKCSDGSTCACTASKSYTPTVPEEKECLGCQCECSAKIYAIDEDGEEREYAVDVNAVVTGDYDIPPCKKCEIIDTTYVWSIDSDDFAKIDGGNTGKTLKLRTIKPGKYVLTVTVTITCSDGHECKCGATKEGVVPEKLCIFKFEENSDPAMDGGLKTASETRIIKRDEYFPLSAEGTDFDNLFWTCTPQKDCKDIIATSKKIPLNGKVRFEWEIYEGEGSFVRIGCLPKSAKNEAGENVVFKPPYVQLPVSRTDTTLTTKIHLAIIDNNLTQKIDPVVDDTIFITTKRSVDKPDEYVVVIIDQKKHKPVTKPEESKDPKEGCLAVYKWSKKAKLDKPEIVLPAGVADNSKMVLGEWIVLNTDIRDNDNLAISCLSQNECPTSGTDLNYQDKIEYTWSASNITNSGSGGVFISGNIGSQVIYQAPLEMPAGSKVLTVKIRVKASNPGPGKVTDDPSDQGEITLEIYQPGIFLQYPATTWLPDTSQKNVATLVSALKFRDQNEIWQPALTHMGRIHFFELMDVSEEKGICMNYPPLLEANECKDLVLKNEEEGKFEAFNSKPLKLKNCTMKDQLLQARTKEAEKEFTIKVYPQDYGAYGFMRSFANTYKDGITETTQNNKAIEALYIPIPWTNDMVQHLRKPYSYKKSYDDPTTKGIELEYPDNRVTLPYDIDENHIPDNGYTDWDGKKIDEPYWDKGDGEFGDDDNIPVGDGFKGDGLTDYEEYRGFMTMQNVTKKSATENVTVTEPRHVRTDHGIKTLFIHRVHEMLDISLFKKISALEVYLISEKQYDASDKTFPVKLNDGKLLVAPRRWINFNFTHAENVIEQWGLKLLDAKFTEKELDGELGIADNTFGYSEVKTRPNIPNYEFEIKINTERITNSCNLKKTDYKDKLAKVVAHELFHGCNICHHGEKPAGKSNDADYDVPELGGLRSGNLLCVMRYDNVGVKTFPGFVPEPVGNSLCNSWEGTEYNKPDTIYGAKKKDGTRDIISIVQNGKGDAALGRGACQQQLRISGREKNTPICRPKEWRQKLGDFKKPNK